MTRAEAAESASQCRSRRSIYNTANEKSQLAYRARRRGARPLARSDRPSRTWTTADVPAIDRASRSKSNATTSPSVGHARPPSGRKILPFVLLIWALTGAFYPAVDLCAGEKERGTLETLLSSPAERSEIVWGKLLTVMLFSMATARAQPGAAWASPGSFVLSQLPQLRARRRRWRFVWLVLALVPVSALFSALCLALAAFARSTKEGQYYLMPLVL